MADHKWRRFELLATRIQRSLAPDARVEHNAMLPGKTGIERQIEIAIWARVGQFDIFIAIDCKDYKDPVDIKDVEMFLGEVEDVGANKAAMISAGGYTPAALARAKRAGLEAYTLVDAESDEWPCLVTLPALFEQRCLTGAAFGLRGTELTSVACSPADIVLHDVEGHLLGSIPQVLGRLWNEGRLPIEVGDHRELVLLNGATFVREGDRLAQVEVRATFRVERIVRFGHVPLASVQGFKDELKGTLETRGFTTDWIVWSEVEAHWEVLPSEEALSIKPTLRALSTNIIADGYAEAELDSLPWPDGLVLPAERG